MKAIAATPPLQHPPAAAAEAVAYFATRLSLQSDVSDVHAAMESGLPGFVLLDSRSVAGWAQGHVPGAIHMPTSEIASRAPAELDPCVPVITYCWGPGCDGATRAALALAQLGFPVKEMIGGIEYWIREGFRVETATGTTRRVRDPLTAPEGAVTCDC